VHEGGGSTPTTVHSIYRHVQSCTIVYAPAERADTLPLFHLYPICTLWTERTCEHAHWTELDNNLFLPPILENIESLAVGTDLHKEYIIYSFKYRYLWGSSSKLNKIAAIRQTREETPDVFTKYV
jgi:hypothetical protein